MTASGETAGATLPRLGARPTGGPVDALRRHWPEYLMEAWGLGAFMVAAGALGTLLFHPASPAVAAVPDPLARRALMGLAMGLTAVALIYSPWGKQSGAHLNPAVTLTFLRLGKVRPWDAAFYVAAQALGGLAGVLLVALTLGAAFTGPPVDYVATLPGEAGTLAALGAEVLISGVLMAVVLVASNTPRLMRLTGLFAGLLVALYITLESPVSGMSMNPARSLASALPADLWQAFWIYLVGPPMGMLLAAEAYLRVAARPVICAKLDHHTRRRCIFCGYGTAEER